MDEHTTNRYEVVVEQGSPHGDLYELEQTTYYRIVDRRTDRIVKVFESEMEASLSRDTGLWDDYHFSGVSDVAIAPDQRSVLVTYHDGREEVLPLPDEEGEPDLPAQPNRGTMPQEGPRPGCPPASIVREAPRSVLPRGWGRR